MADSLEQMQARVAAELKAEFGDSAPAVEKAPAKAPAKAPPPKVAAKPEPESEEPDDSDDGDEAQPSPAQQARAAAESEARGKGWMPKDEWIASGKDEDDWSSAKQFLKKGAEIDERKAERKRVQTMQRELEEMRRILKVKMEADAKAQQAAIKQARDAAIEVGDKARVHELDAAIEAVKAPVVDVTPAEIQEFVKENNEWWGVDPVATRAAVEYYGAMEAKHGRDDVAGNLSKTKAYLSKRFADLFPSDRKDAAEAAQAIVQQATEQQQPRRLSSVSVPTNGGTAAKRGRQWSDLPGDARRVAEKIIAAGAMTKEQYLNSYDWPK